MKSLYMFFYIILYILKINIKKDILKLGYPFPLSAEFDFSTLSINLNLKRLHLKHYFAYIYKLALHR